MEHWYIMNNEAATAEVEQRIKWVEDKFGARQVDERCTSASLTLQMLSGFSSAKLYRLALLDVLRIPEVWCALKPTAKPEYMIKLYKISNGELVICTRYRRAAFVENRISNMCYGCRSFAIYLKTPKGICAPVEIWMEIRRGVPFMDPLYSQS